MATPLEPDGHSAQRHQPGRVDHPNGGQVDHQVLARRIDDAEGLAHAFGRLDIEAPTQPRHEAVVTTIEHDPRDRWRERRVDERTGVGH